jgi:hypothetical protein
MSLACAPRGCTTTMRQQRGSDAGQANQNCGNHNPILASVSLLPRSLSISSYSLAPYPSLLNHPPSSIYLSSIWNPP